MSNLGSGVKRGVENASGAAYETLVRNLWNYIHTTTDVADKA